MSMHMDTRTSTALDRPPTALLRLVSVALPTLPCSLLFPRPWFLEALANTSAEQVWQAHRRCAVSGWLDCKPEAG